MTVKKSNEHVQKMMKLASTIATDSAAPFFGMVEALAFAVADEAITDQKEFKSLIQSLRTHKGVPTLAENRLSETWSCGELGAFKCVKGLFKSMRALPQLPSMTGLYDIACSMRKRGSFAEKGDNAKAALGWDKVRVDAPTTAQLQAAMKHANVARNKGKVQKIRSFADEIAAMITRLEKFRDGYKVNSKAIPANTSPHLKDAIAALGKVKDEKPSLRVIKGGKGNGRKAA